MNIHQWRHRGGHRRQRDLAQRIHVRLVRALGIAEQNDLAVAGCDLLRVRYGLLEHAIIGRDNDDRHVLVDQGDGPVLELAGSIAFGVNVGDFLEFERPFERNRKAGPAAEIEDVPAFGEIARCSIWGSSASASAIKRGTSIKARTILRSSCSDSTPRARPAATARQASTASWQVKALVEATPISGPASVGSTASLSRAIVEV
jgi:hypothetical protein